MDKERAGTAAPCPPRVVLDAFTFAGRAEFFELFFEAAAYGICDGMSDEDHAGSSAVLALAAGG